MSLEKIIQKVKGALRIGAFVTAGSIFALFGTGCPDNPKPVNHAPTIALVQENVYQDMDGHDYFLHEENTDLNMQAVEGFDQDGDDLEYTIKSTNLTGLSMSSSTMTLPAANASWGLYTAEIEVSDGEKTATVNVDIRIVKGYDAARLELESVLNAYQTAGKISFYQISTLQPTPGYDADPADGIMTFTSNGVVRTAGVIDTGSELMPLMLDIPLVDRKNDLDPYDGLPSEQEAVHQSWAPNDIVVTQARNYPSTVAQMTITDEVKALIEETTGITPP